MTMLLLRRQVDLGVYASVETCPIIHLYMLPSYFRVVQTAYIRDHALIFDFPNSESTCIKTILRFCTCRHLFVQTLSVQATHLLQ